MKQSLYVFVKVPHMSISIISCRLHSDERTPAALQQTRSALSRHPNYRREKKIVSVIDYIEINSWWDFCSISQGIVMVPQVWHGWALTLLNDVMQSGTSHWALPFSNYRRPKKRLPCTSKERFYAASTAGICERSWQSVSINRVRCWRCLMSTFDPDWSECEQLPCADISPTTPISKSLCDSAEKVFLHWYPLESGAKKNARNAFTCLTYGSYFRLLPGSYCATQDAWLTRCY